MVWPIRFLISTFFIWLNSWLSGYCVSCSDFAKKAFGQPPVAFLLVYWPIGYKKSAAVWEGRLIGPSVLGFFETGDCFL
jgi:hypothetical protein